MNCTHEYYAALLEGIKYSIAYDRLVFMVSVILDVVGRVTLGDNEDGIILVGFL
jgi:hypothetical protein